MMQSQSLTHVPMHVVKQESSVLSGADFGQASDIMVVLFCRLSVCSCRVRVAT